MALALRKQPGFFASVFSGWGSKTRPGVRSLQDPAVERQRNLYGGSLVRPGTTPILLYLTDVDDASAALDGGDYGPAAAIVRGVRRDPFVAGVLSTRSCGLVRLPRRWHGDTEVLSLLAPGIVDGVESSDPRSLLDYIAPAGELAQMSEDLFLLGACIGELKPDTNGLPILTRLPPDGLRYDIAYNTWSYNSTAGLLAVPPSDPTGPRRFVFATASRSEPWTRGIWAGVASSAINKLHASAYRSSYLGRHSTPIRVATTPSSATEQQEEQWFEAAGGWDNSVVQGKPGYEIKLVEASGRGAELYADALKDANTEIVIAVAGTSGVLDGGSAFSSVSLFRSIRNDLIQGDALALESLLNYQILPAVIQAIFGADTGYTASVEYVSTPPSEMSVIADAQIKAASLIGQLRASLEGTKQAADIPALLSRYDIPVAGDAEAVVVHPPADVQPTVPEAPAPEEELN